MSDVGGTRRMTSERDANSVLDALPHGVVVLDARGETLTANPAARALVAGLADGPSSCCRDLFLCREPGGPCERGCLVERAAGGTFALTETRVDMPGGASPGALWVTAAPLGDGDGAGRRVVLVMRAGERGDRRRRTDVRFVAEPELRIYALGRTRVESLTDSLDEQWLRQRAGQVLKYLLCNRGRPVLVDEIAESIWPARGRQTVGNARYVVHALRARLEPRRAPNQSSAFVVASGGGYALDRDRVWIDVDEFETAIDEGRAAMARLDPASAREHFDRAIALYRGEFLADEPYAHWANDERIRLAGMAAHAVRVSTALAYERGDPEAANAYLERLSELEPFDSGVHREYIAALLHAGQRGQAKQCYDRFAERLRREFGETPDFDLASLRGFSPRPG
jgi:two-component SAPR family response regulator